MNIRIYYLLMVMLFATFGMTARAQTLTIGEVEAGPGPVSVPVYMEDFTNVEGFQIAFSFDPQILTGFDGIENRFVTGSNIIWAPQYNADEGKVVVTFMDFDFASYDIDEKIFDLKFQYAGGHDVDIIFDPGNTEIMSGGGVVMDNEGITFNSGAVLADPDIVAGTVSMETVTGVAPDQEVLMPVHMEGDGFTNIESIDLVIGFEPGQLTYEEIVLNEDLDFDVVQTVLQSDGELRIMLTSTTGLDLSDAHIADIRFTYTAVTEAIVTFEPGGEIASPAGALAFETENGVFVPDEFDVTLNIPDLFEYSLDQVEVPVEIHGEFPTNAGSVSLRIEYDNSIIGYSGFESEYGDNWSIGSTDPLILELVIFDTDGVELIDGTDLITLRFDFLEVGTSPIEILDGSSVQTPLGVTMPFTPNNGSVGIAVSPTVYDALLDARENTFLEVTNPGSNSIAAVTTYPDEFLEFVEEGGFTIPALTDVWKVDAQFMSEEPMVAGTELHITYGDLAFDYIVEEEVPAGEALFLSDLILSVYPEADVRTTLLDHAGLVETWNVDIRSPITYATTLHFAVVTDDDDFTNVESTEAWWKGFKLDDDALEMTVYGDPQLLFAFNGMPVGTGFEEEFCANQDIDVTLHEVIVGEEPFTIVYTVNDQEFTAENVFEGDTIYSTADHDALAAGTYDIVITSIIDNAGNYVVDPEDVYFGTVIINPEPAVLFAFNDIIVETGSHLEFSPTEEVTVTLNEIIQGYGPIELTYVLNDEDPVTVEGINEGDTLFEDVLPEGVHTLKLTSLIDANGCAVADPEEIYQLTIEVFQLFEVTFLVDIGPAIEYYDQVEGFDDFDPEEHSILITGSLLGWAEPGTDPDQVMEVTDDPNIYRVVFYLDAGSYQYKYFSDVVGDGWEGGEWPGDPNREVVVEGDMTVENIFGWPDDPVSTDPMPENITLSLYPNPASSYLTIEANAEINEIRMMDMLGKVVYSGTIQGRTHQMNVSDHKNGIYFIQVLTDTGVITERVQITR